MFVKLCRPQSSAAARACVLALTGLVAIGAPASRAQSAGTPHVIRIAYSVDVLDETQNIALDAMKARVAALGEEHKDVTIDFETYDAQNSVDKQISDVQTALIKKPDVLIFSAVDAKGSLPALEAARAAGVKVIDRRPSDPEPDAVTVAFYAYDEAQYAKATTTWIESYLKDHPQASLHIGLIYGAPAQTAQLRRCDAIAELAARMPDRIQIVAKGYGNWLTDTAQNLTQDWLLAHHDMNYVATANDIMALGASNALVTADRKKDVLVSGYDLTDDGLQRIKRGEQDFDTGTSLKDSGQVIDVAVGLAQGTFKDRTYHLKPIYAADAKNVDQTMAALKR